MDPPVPGTQGPYGSAQPCTNMCEPALLLRTTYVLTSNLYQIIPDACAIIPQVMRHPQTVTYPGRGRSIPCTSGGLIAPTPNRFYGGHP